MISSPLRYEQEEKADWEFMRLSLPVTCSERFITEQEKARRWQETQMPNANTNTNTDAKYKYKYQIQI